ncbi:MAG: YjbH domain-containing protein [Pseudomonadota bacterium]
MRLRVRSLRACHLATATAASITASAAIPQSLETSSYTLYGTPGLIEMPTAEMAPDAELGLSFSFGADEQTRSTLTFQIAPFLSGSFRYARLPDFQPDGDDLFDRSFDLRLRLLEEGDWWPAVALGLQDFIGTGAYSGEYIVATKSFGAGGQIRVTGGIGWGRFASGNRIAREDAERETDFVETGGTANLDQLFTGPVGAFGGISWQATERLRFSVEYSSDGYATEEERDLFEPESPWNFGVDYRIARGVHLSAASLYGTDIGVQLSFTLNPNDPPAGPGLETAPLPVGVRAPRSADALGWSGDWIERPNAPAQLRSVIADALAAEGIEAEAIALSRTRIELRISNRRWPAQAQAIGRTARILSVALPASVETFRIVPVSNGVPSAAITLLRSDVEALEHAPAQAVINRVVITGGAEGRPADLVTLDPYPRLSWGLSPYYELGFFDVDTPVRAEVGVSLDADLEFAPGLIASVDIEQPIVGNLGDLAFDPEGEIPVVRSDFADYLDTNAPRLRRLTFAHYGRPSDTLYSRVTAGYLELMYAGVSGEVLWKPVASRLALGAELNYVEKRDPDDPFGFDDYDVVTGHVSAYYDFGNGYFGQVDAGRYLGGDVGATFAFDRAFDNGWRVGAFATFTDVPFDDFGEGSFDKGIRLSIPVAWLAGQPTRRASTTVLRPLTRDGGARVSVSGRLYDRVRDSHRPQIEARSGRFWK